ncbi:MAG: glycosyltransferase family 4 protein [Candidatus Gracilibacteria bacterium]
MRIGIDARMYSPKFTGIGRYNYELINHLFEIDKENTYVIFMNEPEYSEFTFSAKNVEKICAGAKYYSLGEQLSFMKKLYQARLDVMHFTHFNNALLYFKKQTVTIHDLTLSFFPGKKMTKWYHRVAYFLSVWGVTKKAYRIIAISENTKNDLIKVLRVPEKKITVVTEGASQDFSKITDKMRLSETKKRLGLSRPFFLYTGVWRDHKNLVGLIKAFHKLTLSKDFDADLVITGRHDPVYTEVKDTVQELHLEDRVKLVGMVSEGDLTALYSLATLYTFPSFYEGFGLTILEAFAAELPVACSNTSSLPEVGGDAVIYFDPYSIDDMAEKIGMLYDDKELQKELILKGKKQLSVFSWEDMTKKIHDIYLMKN